MNRYAALYLVTLFVIVPLDFLFLGVVAKDFFTSQVGNMLGEPEWRYLNVRRLFNYIAESINEGTQWSVFEPNDERLWMQLRIAASNFLTRTWREGALFGFFCYATFDLTSLALLKHWSWPVAIVDVAWGSFVTAVSSTAGLLVANWLVAKM